MRQITSALLIGLALSVLTAGCQSPDDRGIALAPVKDDAADSLKKNEIAGFAEGNNRFACELHKRLSEQDGNLAFSPLSVQLAFGMASEAVLEDCQREIKNVVCLDQPQEQLHRILAGTSGRLERTLTRHGSFFGVANLLLVDSKANPPDAFRNLIQNTYGGKLIRFRADSGSSRSEAEEYLDSWVSTESNGFLADMIEPGFLEQGDSLVLSSSAYLKAKWQKEFAWDETDYYTFWLNREERVETPFISQRNKFLYLKNETLQLLLMPYKQGSLEMAFLLPRDFEGLKELEAQLDSKSLGDWIEQCKTVEVVVDIPLFEIKSDVDLVGPLEEMGLSEPFSGGFKSWLGRGTVIRRVLQSTRIAIDEKGTVAATATAAVGNWLSNNNDPERPETFCANHPFLFMIHDRETGIILFMGRVTDPR